MNFKFKTVMFLMLMLFCVGSVCAADNTTSDNVTVELPDYYDSDIDEVNDEDEINLDDIEASQNLTANQREILNHTKECSILADNLADEKDEEKRTNILWDMEYELNTLCDLFHNEIRDLDQEKNNLQNTLSKINDDTEDSLLKIEIEDKIVELNQGIKLAEKAIHEIALKLVEIESIRG